MGLSRAYLGAHWLSDATAGILLGTSCALLGALIAGLLQQRQHRRRQPARTQRPAGVPPPDSRKGAGTRHESDRAHRRERPIQAEADGHRCAARRHGTGHAAEGRFLPASRYRHPGDVIRLIISGLVLAGTLAAVMVAHRRLLGPGAAAVTWLGSDLAGRLRPACCRWPSLSWLLGSWPLPCGTAGSACWAASPRAVAAGAGLAGILYLAGDQHPHEVTAAAGHGSLLASAAFPGPALLAAAAAVTVAAAPWPSRPWRRTAWITLGAAAGARLITGTVLPAN